MTSRDLLQHGETATAVLSACERYRFRLARVWDWKRPRMIFVMLNPSTADAATDDPTIRRCRGFAKRENCGGFEVVNLFAWRATDPADLLRADDPVGDGNDRYIADAMAPSDPPTDPPNGPVVAAWGAHPAARLRAPAVATQLCWLVPFHLHCLGTSKDGSPRHPLMLRADTPLQPFPVRKGETS